MNEAMHKVLLEENLHLLLRQCPLTLRIRFTSRTMLHASQAVHGGLQDQDPVMAGTIYRPEPC